MTALLTLVIFLIGADTTLRGNVERWNRSGYITLSHLWDRLFLTSAFVAGFIGTLAYRISGDNPLIAVIFAVLGYVLTFTSFTDIKLRLAPYELSALGNYLMFPVGLLGPWLIAGNSDVDFPNLMPYPFIFGNPVADAYLQEALWLAIPVALFFFAPRGIGMADLKILTMVGFGLSWWVGFTPMLLLLVGASLLQLLSFIPARVFGWGELHPQKKSLLNPKGKPRRAMPFIPALSISFIAGPAIWAAVGLPLFQFPGLVY